MTKRFELRLCSNGIYYVYENGTLTDIDFDKFNKESAYALIDEVNALYEEKEKLKIFLKAVNEELSLANRDNDTLAEENEQLRKENDMFSCELSVSANKEISRNCRIAELEEENEQLKQQNNQQYEQLSRLYNLIEQKEWRVLTDIIDNFKKSDEQLQKEWRTYGDVE